MKSFFSPRNAFIGGLLLGLVAAAVMLVPQGKPHGFDVDAFGHLPALEGGRVKPIDSIARNTLLMIKGKQSLRFDPDGDGPQPVATIGPDEWLLDVLFRPEVADKQKLFMIHNPDVLGLMNQQITSEHDYSFETIKPFIPEIQRQGELAQRKEPKERSAFESAVANLYERLFVYVRLKNTLQLEGTPGIAFELASLNGPQSAQRRSFLNEAAYFRAIPNAGTVSDGWQNMGMALETAARGTVNPALDAWSRMALAYRAQDPGNFNKAVADAGAAAAAVQADAASEAGAELVFNRAQPFYVGMVIYVLAMLAVFVSWLWQGDFFRSAGYGLLLSGAVVHTGGLISRVILQGRPPVTNLYSSAVFVGWGAVILGVILERMYRKGFGTVVAAAAGFASLIVAHHLTGDGDTMEMMRAVLDNNFWLGTHVITITIGYSGTFLAGGIAIAWTIWKHVTKGTDANVSKVLYGMAYGVICFALFFSFVGTVLGGIWADQSWGRFWGWDPKENGALLLVLWNAIILHARWGGYARERGIMAMAIFGNVITSLSWFGVNMLGVGLHSYGFMDKAFYALTGFIASQLVIMAFTLAPAQFWKGLGGAPGKSQPAAAGGR